MRVRSVVAAIAAFVLAGCGGGGGETGTAPLVVSHEPPVYFADLHGHTSYSDGRLLPVDAYTWARDEAHLDVFALTDHLELVDAAEWEDTCEQARAANEEGAFVAFPGLEWTKPQGHMCLFDPQTRTWPTDTAACYQAVVDAGIVAKINHPAGYGTVVFDGVAYSELGDRAVQLMEVRSDPELQAYIRALSLGWHLSPDGSSDTHVAQWGTSGTWTAILAPALTTPDIMDALHHRHTYSTTDRNCEMRLLVNGGMMGDIVGEPAASAQIFLTISDPDAADLTGKVDLYEDGAVVDRHEPRAAALEWRLTRTTTSWLRYRLTVTGSSPPRYG